MKTTVVWNPRSGKAEASAAIRESLEKRPGYELFEATERDEVIESVRRALRQGTDRIYAAGGDGTISAGVAALMDAKRRIPLGVIPLGTGNDFARTLAIPLEPADAIACLDQAPLRRLDVVEMADEHNQTHYYVNMASAGNSDRVIDQITDEQKKWWGPFSYLRGALDLANDLETYSIVIEDASGKRESFEVWNLMIANGRTSGGGYSVAPLARPDDGKIDLVVVRSGSLPEMVEAGARLLLDSLLESNLIEYRQSTSFKIESSPRLRFTADGDLVERAPVRFDVRAEAIEMFVGPEFDAT